jgi:hypothetical protein
LDAARGDLTREFYDKTKLQMSDKILGRQAEERAEEKLNLG